MFCLQPSLCISALHMLAIKNLMGIYQPIISCAVLYVMCFFVSWVVHRFIVLILLFNNQGAPPCTHYAQRGVCKFGSACKFDHTVGTLSYSPSASSLTDVPVAPYPVGSSIGTLAPSSSSSELRPELISGSSKDSVSSRMSSSMSTSSGSIGSTFSQGGPTPHSTVQQSAPGSGPSSGSSNGSTEPRTSN